MIKFELLCDAFNNLTKAPDKFLSGGQLTGEFKDLLKNVYDFGQNQERTSKKALPELIIKDFDDEQIWQELELQNEDSLPNLINKAAHLLVSKSLSFPVETEPIDVPDDKHDRKKVKEKKAKKSEAISTDEESDENLDEEEEEMDTDEMEDEELLKMDRPKKVKIVPSELDDDFFKLSEMEAFLKDQEEKGDNLGVDLFGGVPSDSEEEDERPKYKDFFEEQDDEEYHGNGEIDEDHDDNEYDEDDQLEENYDEDDEQGGQSSNEDKTKKVKFNLQPESKDESSSEESLDDKSSKIKSSFEIREERLRKKIAQLEDEALQDKAWPLKGEVNAAVRPVNSLLEEVVEFDMTKRPPPIITEETSNRLEDIIKQRIRDQAYDDVERKVKPVATPNEFKKKLVLDQEKSKISLAEVYEKEYLKQKGGQNQDALDQPEVEPEEHQVIKRMMKSLFTKLDALSNFFFVPKPLAPDLKIVSNLPAVNVEEVAPVAASDAKLLAPEEIGGSYRKSLVSQEEKTKTDKKRERRKKKVLQATKFKAKALKDANKPASYDDELKKVMKYKNVTKLDEQSNKTSKSSTDFFSKLQDEVQKPRKDGEKKRKSKLPTKSAKKLKL